MKPWRLSRLDRYILFKFLGTYALFLSLIMLIAIVFDISQKVDNFMSQGADFKHIIGDYYVNFVAEYGTTFTGLIVFLSTIFFTGRMADRTEIAAILTSGVSFRRLLYPYFLGASLLFLGTAYLSHFVIPETTGKRQDFEDRFVKDEIEPSRPINIHRQIAPGHYVFVETWSPERLGGYHFTYEVMSDSKLTEKLTADFMRFDTIRRAWRLENWNHRVINGASEQTLHQGRTLDTNFSFGPEIFSADARQTSRMNSPELLEFLQQERLSGSEAISKHLLVWHRRTAHPFAIFILVLIAVSVATEKRRGGIGAKIAFGLLLVVAYIFVMQVSGTFISSPYISPWLAAWIPNFLFAGLGMYLYLRAAK